MRIVRSPVSFEFKPIRQPMLWAAIAYSLGILMGKYCWRPFSLWIAATSVFLFAGVFFLRHRQLFARFLAFGSLFCCGALLIQFHSVPQLDTSLDRYADGRELQITAHVIRDGRLREASFGEAREALDVETEQIETEDNNRITLKSGVRLSLYQKRGDVSEEEPRGPDCNSTLTPLFHYGERIRFTAKLRQPRNFRNPGAFDYEGYLASNEIAAVGSGRIDSVERLPGFRGQGIEAWRQHLHHSVIGKIHELWPPSQAALLDAMVLGEESFIDRSTRVDFQRSGTYHILVVSGMNVSILAFVVFWTLRRLRFNEILSTLLTVISCFAYAFLTEVGAPVWRATLMCAIYLGTRLLYRDRAMVNALGAAALALLALDPRQLFSPSFQMTFLCVLIVSAIGLPLLERTSQFYRQALWHWSSDEYTILLAPEVAQFRSDLKLLIGRVGRFTGERFSALLVRGMMRLSFGIYDLLAISAIMQAGLALPMAYYFHRATTIGLPANFLVVPLTQWMMPASVLAIVLGYISPWLAKVPAAIAAAALTGITGTVRGLGGLRLADLRLATPSSAIIAAAVFAIILATLSARCRPLFTGAGLVAFATVAMLLAVIPPRPQLQRGALEVTAIDVGEGDSILVVTPQGQTLLVDAGGQIGGGSSQLDFGEDVVAPYLWSRGIASLDVVAITHAHSDHIGGVPAILKDFRPRELWLGVRPPSEALDRLLADAQQLGVKLVRHYDGDTLHLGGLQIEVLAPERDAPVGSGPENNDSMVLRVSAGSASALLEGDAQKQVEKRIAAIHDLQVGLLKVGHHGSNNATTPELLEAAKPQFAVISDGYRNSFDLPRLEVLDRLGSRGIRVYRTDQQGAVTFYLDGNSVTAWPWAAHRQP